MPVFFLRVYGRNSGIKFFSFFFFLTKMSCKMETPKVNSVARMKIKMMMMMMTIT